MSRTKFLWSIIILVTLGVCTAAGFAFWHQFNPATPTSDSPPMTSTPLHPTPASPTVPASPTNTDSASGTPTSSGAPTTPTIDANPTDLHIQKPPEASVTAKSDQTSTPTISQTLPEAKKNGDTYLPLSKVSCEQNCRSYADSKELRYCQEYCGLTPPMATNDCTSLKDLEKDYCYKDQAIAKTDPSLCKNVSDTNIRTTCQNRVTENIVDQSRQSAGTN